MFLFLTSTTFLYFINILYIIILNMYYLSYCLCDPCYCLRWSFLYRVLFSIIFIIIIIITIIIVIIIMSPIEGEERRVSSTATTRKLLTFCCCWPGVLFFLPGCTFSVALKGVSRTRDLTPP